MKKILPVYFFLFITFFLDAQVGSLALTYEHYVLSNGLEVILQPDPQVKEVAVEFWIKEGNRIDEEGKFGLMHFFEHVMPWTPIDSISYATYRAYRTNSNAQVRKDFSRYFLQAKPEGLDPTLEMAAGRLKAGAERISEKRVEHERKRVLAEIERNAKNPLWSAEGGMAINIGVFGEDHPYGHNGYGKVEYNINFTLDDFRKRYDEVVFAENIILFIVGKFDVVATKSNIRKHFSDVRSGKPNKIKVKKSKHSPEHITMNNPSPKDDKNTLLYSWNVPAYGTKDDSALRLLATILKERIKTKKSSIETYLDSEASVSSYEHGSRFSIKVTFSATKDSTRVENLIQQAINQLITNGVTTLELKNALQSQVETIQEMQQNLGFQYSRVELLGKGLLFKNDPHFYLTRLDEQAQLTVKGINKVAKKWLSPNAFSILFQATTKI